MFRNCLFVSFLGLFVLLLFCDGVNSFIYDYYTGKSVPAEYVLRYAHDPIFRECTVNVRPCSKSESRRVDGSCNNLKMPSRGMQRTPFKRLLSPRYGPNNTIPALSHSGKSLPSARVVRTSLQKDKRVVSNRFAISLLHIGGFHTLDLIRTDTVLRYLFQITHCCTEAGLNDPRCIPIRVPKDDPYLKKTGVTCLNFTRATTYQELGCLTNDHPADQLNHETPFLDLSTVYGTNNTLSQQLRSFENGFLKMELRNKHIVPQDGSRICVANKKGWPCYYIGDSTAHFHPRLVIFTVWFMRLHNELASGLALMNPCWDDEKLFQVARQINIAIAQQIYLHEWVGNILGIENMLKRGLISSDGGYVNVYDEKLEPQMLAEYETGLRALHLLLDDSFGLYDKKANLVGVTSLNRWLFATGILDQDDNMEIIGRSLFYQPSGDDINYSDPGLAENLFMMYQKAHDMFSIDIQRSRDFGMRTYNEYRKHCGLPVAKTFEDLQPDMEMEKIITLKNLYHDVDSIEFFAGILSEKPVPGAVIGPTLFCIIETQVDHVRKYDRFWFERDHALGFRPAQLAEIRKTSLALVACLTVDGLKSVQPHAMRIVSEENPLINCDKYRKIDLRKWRDDNCDFTPQGRQYRSVVKEENNIDETN